MAGEGVCGAPGKAHCCTSCSGDPRVEAMLRGLSPPCLPTCFLHQDDDHLELLSGVWVQTSPLPTQAHLPPVLGLPVGCGRGLGLATLSQRWSDVMAPHGEGGRLD